MDDSDLQRIRAARLAELQSQSTSSQSHDPSSSADQQQQQQQQRDAEQQSRHHILSQLLDPSARDRLRRIALVKPDRANGVEELLMRMAKSGQIRQRVSEPELVGLLEELSGQEGKEKEKVGVIRNLRRQDSDDDWD